MKVEVVLKDETITIEDVHFYSFERNFIVVNTADPKTRSYFKLSTVLKLKETN